MKKLVYKCFYSAVWSHQCFLNDHKDMEMMFVAYYTDRWADNYSKKICKGVVLKGLRYRGSPTYMVFIDADPITAVFGPINVS